MINSISTQLNFYIGTIADFDEILVCCAHLCETKNSKILTFFKTLSSVVRAS